MAQYIVVAQECDRPELFTSLKKLYEQRVELLCELGTDRQITFYRMKQVLRSGEALTLHDPHGILTESEGNITVTKFGA